jgi:hypothetical protein
MPKWESVAKILLARAKSFNAESAEGAEGAAVKGKSEREVREV